MSDKPPSGVVAFLREARRRKVYIAAVAYVGVAVVLIELSGAVSDALLFPDWTGRLITFLLMLGFPVVLVLSWIFDVTSSGVVRTDASHDEAPAATATNPGPAPSGARRAGRARPAGKPLPPMPEPGKRPATQPLVEEAPDPERVNRAALAHIRHELRTPINGILGYTEMILEDEDDQALTADLARIRDAGGRLLELIDEVLDPKRLNESADASDLERYATRIRLDLRTPVSAVVGYTEMLLESAEESGRDDLVPDLERIRGAAKRLLELSEDLVGLATAGAASGELGQSDTSELARGVLAKIRPVSGEAQVDGQGRLLVVDDNEMNRDLLSRQLARQGYIVLTAADGAKALDVLGEQDVDLVLLDVIMPVMDGVETLRRIKADERLRDIPVLMLSSLDEVDSAIRCIELGAEDYLAKPVEAALLDARIGANLEIRRMRQRERAYRERMEADEAFIEQLLLGSFPAGVAERVRSGDAAVADLYPEATVLRCRLKGWPRPASSGAFAERIGRLRHICLGLEELAANHGVDTCLWRPDGFVAVAGVPEARDDHVEAAVALARDVLAYQHSTPEGEEPLRLALGLHTGPLLAAVLGGERLRYDVWGEALDGAEGIAAAAQAGTLVVSPPVQARLADASAFEARGVADIPGAGQMRTFVLRGPAAGGLAAG